MDEATPTPIAANRSRQNRYLLALCVVLALCVPLLCATYIARLIAEVEHDAYTKLGAIARLQAGQIEDWLAEREADLMLSSRRSMLDATTLSAVLSAGRVDGQRRRALTEELARLREAHHYTWLALYDRRGRLVLATGVPCSAADATLLERAAAAASAVHGELAAANGEQRLIALAAPLISVQRRGPSGYLAACTDLSGPVIARVERWPTVSPSAESLLAEVHDGKVVLLSRARNATAAAAVLGQGLATAVPVAGQAVGEDAVPVVLDGAPGAALLAVRQPIKGTSWQLFSQVERREVFAPVWRTLRWIGAGVLASALSIVAALLVFWRQRERTQQLSLLAEKARSDRIINHFFTLPFVGMAIVSPTTRRFIRCNDQACLLTGYTHDELYARSWRDIVHPDDYARSIAEIARLGRGECDGVSLELRLLRSDRSTIFINADIKAVRQPDGQLDYLLGTAQDITQRRQHELALDSANQALHAKQAELERKNEILCQAQTDLRSSDERHAAIIHSVNDALINTDSQGTIVAWNPATERIFGYRGDEIIGQPIDRLLPAALRDKYRADIDQLLRGDAPRLLDQLVELRAQHRDGNEFDIDVSLTRWQVSDGSYYTATVRDISRRKHTEQSLRLLSEAVRQSPESIVITDTQARIEFVNEAFVAQTGYAADEVIGRNPQLLNSGLTPPQTYAAMWAALTRGEAWKGEFHNRRRDGSDFVEFARVAPIRQADGSISHYLAIKEEITEKKRLGAELDNYRFRLEELVEQRTTQLAEASIRAEAANHAKSAFLANMSHEIRTPLNAIVGLTHLLRHSDPTTDQQERLQKVDTAAAHLLKLINNILDFSKIEANKMSLEASDFCLVALFDSVRSMTIDAAREKQLAINIELGDTPTWLHGDANRLRQALLNYAGNAVKFTDYGAVTLRAALVEAQDDELLLRFAVEDSGPGIAADKLPRLFQSFEQADPSDTRRYGGTGLGLAITRRLAQLMGGEVGAHSEPLRGSTFWFTARLRRASGVKPAVTASVADDSENTLRRDCAGAHILLADDVAVNLEVAQLLLHSVGLQVETARNGREAVDKARISRYDLILMDIQMPIMNGIEATHAIRQLPGRAQIPILAMTANAFDDDRQRCLAAGMNDFIAKPVDPATLFAVLHAWLPARSGDTDTASTLAGDADATEAVEATEGSARGVRQRLAAVAGLDVEQTLKQLRGDENKLDHIIALFIGEHAQSTATIAAALAAGQMDLAEQRVHALKGSAGLIGANRVAERCSALLKAIRNEAGASAYEQCYAALAPELAALLAALAQARSGGSAVEAPPPTAPTAQLVLAKLAALLANGDLAAGAWAKEHRDLLCARFGEPGQALLSAIDGYDFERARDALNEVQQNETPA